MRNGMKARGSEGRDGQGEVGTERGERWEGG